jgi:hypothetical protein
MVPTTAVDNPQQSAPRQPAAIGPKGKVVELKGCNLLSGPTPASGQIRLFDDVDTMSAARSIATECCSAISGASGPKRPTTFRIHRLWCNFRAHSCNEDRADDLAGATGSEGAAGGQLRSKHIPFNIRGRSASENVHTTGLGWFLDEYCRLKSL